MFCNWDLFKEGKFWVKCDSKEEFLEFIKKMAEIGIKDIPLWRTYEIRNCYKVNSSGCAVFERDDFINCNEFVTNFKYVKDYPEEVNKIFESEFRKDIIGQKVDTHFEICKELNDIYDRKNRDYDDSFSKSFKEYGMSAPCIRIEDKLERLKSLAIKKKEIKVKDESIEDTLKDLANYAILTLIELKYRDDK